jgi:hypothetical protein
LLISSYRLEECRVKVEANLSKAVKLAREWLEMQDIKELIELGTSLLGGEKLRRIIELASKEVRGLETCQLLCLEQASQNNAEPKML